MAVAGLAAGLALIVTLSLEGCAKSAPDAQQGTDRQVTPPKGAAGPSTPEDPRTPKPTPVFKVEVLNRYKHDVGAYTQGLLVADGKLYESTGQKGESGVRLVDLETGEILKRRDLDYGYFGEGLASVGGLLYQLSWHAGEAFVFERESLRQLSYKYTYPGEGWGLTSCDEGLVMSDGTEFIRFLNPKGMTEIRRIRVTDQDVPIVQLNELEYINGEIWANVWKSDAIARIDPATGKVNSWLDLHGILEPEKVKSPIEEVLNGIAYDAVNDKIYVTGKRWPSLFEIRVIE